MSDERRQEAPTAGPTEASPRGLERLVEGSSVEPPGDPLARADDNAEAAKPAEGWELTWQFGSEVYQEVATLLGRIEVSIGYHLDREAHFRRVDGAVAGLALVASASGLGTLLRDAWAEAAWLVGVSAVVQALARRLKLERETERHRSLYVQFNQLKAEVQSLDVINAATYKRLAAKMTKLEGDERLTKRAALMVAQIEKERACGQPPSFHLRWWVRPFRHLVPNGLADLMVKPQA